MGWEWKRLYFFSVGLILLGDADGFSVWNKSPVPEWQTGRSTLSRDQPQPPLQNVVFDTPRIQPFDVASTNANAEWTTLESNSQLPTSRSQIVQHGSIPSQTSFGADKPVQNVQGSYRTAPSRPYWYASSSWKPSNCGPSARNQDVARPTAHFQGSENELAPTYEQNSYGAQISEASRWYSLQGQHPQASMSQNTPSQSNKPMPQSSWSLGNQYPATAINQVHHAAQPTGPSSWYTSGRLSVPSPSQSQSMGSLTQPANQFMTPSQTTSESSVVSQGQGRYMTQSAAASGLYDAHGSGLYDAHASGLHDAHTSSQHSFSQGQRTPSFSQLEDAPAQVPESQTQPSYKPMSPTQSSVSKSYSLIRPGAKWYKVDPLRLQVMPLLPSQGSSMFSTISQNTANPSVPVPQAPWRSPNIFASLDQISPELEASSQESSSAAWAAQRPGFYFGAPAEGASSWQAPGQYHPVPQSVVSLPRHFDQDRPVSDGQSRAYMSTREMLNNF